MAVQTASEGVKRARRTLYAILLADHPHPAPAACDAGLRAGDPGGAGGVTDTRFTLTLPRGTDDSSPIIHVDHTACILCDRCIRGCSEIRHNFVIGRTGKGAAAGIAFDTDVPMGSSTCVGCGECMVSCPTGALTNKRVLDVGVPAGEPTTPEELLALPMFHGISGTFLRLNQGSVIRRRVRPGGLICREGEYGSTAFYILSGEVEVSISAPMGHVTSRADQTGGGIRNVLHRLTSLVRAGKTSAAGGTAGSSHRRPRYLAYDTRWPSSAPASCSAR